MTSPIKIPRSRELRAWMVRYNITNQALAEKLGITHQRVSVLFRRDTMPSDLHKECIRLGFPKELLPEPLNQKGGRPRKKRIPIFPGLVNQAEA